MLNPPSSSPLGWAESTLLWRLPQHVRLSQQIPLVWVAETPCPECAPRRYSPCWCCCGDGGGGGCRCCGCAPCPCWSFLFFLFSFLSAPLNCQTEAEQAQTTPPPPPPPLLGARSIARSPKATQKGEATSGKRRQSKAEQTYFPTLVDIIEEKTYCSNGFWYVVVCYALNFSI